jgi:lysophospholipase L1-like esterase
VKQPTGDGGYVPFEHARTILAARERLKLLVFGDSIANGATTSSYYRSFPWLWARSLREKHSAPVQVLNWSRGGRTSADGVALVEEAARACLPDLALVAFGINDQKPPESRLRGSGAPSVPPNRYWSNVGRIAVTLQKRGGCDVVLVSPCRLPGLRDAEPYRDALAELARGLDCVLADVTSAWPEDDEHLIAEDGAHPNDAGHALYARVLEDLGL